jgi:hypothetical protein
MKNLKLIPTLFVSLTLFTPVQGSLPSSLKSLYENPNNLAAATSSGFVALLLAASYDSEVRLIKTINHALTVITDDEITPLLRDVLTARKKHALSSTLAAAAFAGGSFYFTRYLNLKAPDTRGKDAENVARPTVNKGALGFGALSGGLLYTIIQGVRSVSHEKIIKALQEYIKLADNTSSEDKQKAKNDLVALLQANAAAPHAFKTALKVAGIGIVGIAGVYINELIAAISGACGG